MRSGRRVASVAIDRRRRLTASRVGRSRTEDATAAHRAAPRRAPACSRARRRDRRPRPRPGRPSSAARAAACASRAASGWRAPARGRRRPEIAIDERDVERLARRARPALPTPWPPCASMRPQRVICSTSTVRLTAWSSTMSTRRPARAPSVIGRAGSSEAAARATIVNQNVEPTPGVLSTPISPPISSHSRRLIARPRPVPPYCRVVDASTWLKERNSRSMRSLGIPMPVSRTETRSRQPSVGVSRRSRRPRSPRRPLRRRS